ncbi:site-specific integrase, partial [Asticcacaulis sp. DXS10W]
SCLQAIVGKTHFVRSLKTGRWADAVRMIRVVSVEFENMLRKAEGASEISVSFISGAAPQEIVHSPPVPTPEPANDEMTLQQVFDMFMSDPSKKRAWTTMARYRETMGVVFEVIPPSTPIKKVDRTMCRHVLEMVQWLPANATKRFPNQPIRMLCDKAKNGQIKRLISAQTVNFYMICFTAVLSFALSEEWADKNPAKGLRVADPVRAKDKRLPYDDGQLKQIFSTSIYTTKADQYRDTAKFWIPIIGLFGMRLNEIAGLRVADIQTIDGVECFIVKEAEDKSIKTLASERTVPIPDMIKDGVLALAQRRRQQGYARLFPDVHRDGRGLYSHEFSKWWGRHARNEGFFKERTCFHSLRHNFRQAMREARIDEEIVLALGGWTPSGKSEVQRNYGSGVPIHMLKDAINRIRYSELDLIHIL